MCSELLKVILAQWGGEKPYLRFTISNFFLTFVEVPRPPNTGLSLSEGRAAVCEEDPSVRMLLCLVCLHQKVEGRGSLHLQNQHKAH